MDGDAAYLRAHHLYFAHVDTGTDLDSEAGEGSSELDAAGDGPARLLERGEEPVPCGVELATPMPPEGAADDGVVPSHQLTPSTVSQLGGQAGGPHDVREHHRRKEALRGFRPPRHRR